MLEGQGGMGMKQRMGKGIEHREAELHREEETAVKGAHDPVSKDDRAWGQVMSGWCGVARAREHGRALWLCKVGGCFQRACQAQRYTVCPVLSILCVPSWLSHLAVCMLIKGLPSPSLLCCSHHAVPNLCHMC